MDDIAAIFDVGATMANSVIELSTIPLEPELKYAILTRIIVQTVLRITIFVVMRRYRKSTLARDRQFLMLGTVGLVVCSWIGTLLQMYRPKETLRRIKVFPLNASEQRYVFVVLSVLMGSAFALKRVHEINLIRKKIV